MLFFLNSGDRTWQPLLVSSQPILDFLEPCLSYKLEILSEDRDTWVGQNFLLHKVDMENSAVESTKDLNVFNHVFY